MLTAVDLTKKSPLHLAAKHGHISVMECLLRNGFKPNARDRTLKTPLHIAAYYGQAIAADTLLKNGGDMKLKDSSGRTVFHYACCGSKPELLVTL